jgi:ABC-type ATPase with predicted acetyltransferase domain
MMDILEGASIERVGRADYEPFAGLHYRRGSLPVVDKIFALRLPRFGRVAVIVYSFAPAHLLARRLALGGLSGSGLGRAEKMEFINANIRSISRVIVLPEFRGASLASCLVRRTLGRFDVPVVEAVAAMGRFNSFFEKAGMKKFVPPVSERQKRMKGVLADAGLRDDMLFDPDMAMGYIDKLAARKQEHIWKEIGVFIGAYGRRRLIDDKRERLALTLSRLSGRICYFYHINGELKF